MGTTMVARLRLLLLTIVVAGCGLLADERPKLGVSNGTTLVVTVTVNGVPVGDFPPGGPAHEIDESQLPPLPWLVEARSASGRVLTSMTVVPGSVTSTTRADGSSGRSGVLGRVDLSCGRLDIWAGAPAGGPPPGPGVPGDCVP